MGDALFWNDTLPEWYQGGMISSAHDKDSSAPLDMPYSYVLFCYPRDYTPVCTQELVELQKHLKDFQAKNIEVFAASTDSPETHNLFFNDEEAFPAKEVPNIEYPALTLRPHLLTEYGKTLLLNEFGYTNRIAVVVKEGAVRFIYQTDNATPRDIAVLLGAL